MAGDFGEERDFAARKAEWVRREQVSPRTALAMAGLVWNRDLSDRDPDGPLPAEEPNPPDDSGAFGSARCNDAQEIVARWRDGAEADGWSPRETVIRMGRRAGGHVGTPASTSACGPGAATGRPSRPAGGQRPGPG